MCINCGLFNEFTFHNVVHPIQPQIQYTKMAYILLSDVL